MRTASRGRSAGRPSDPRSRSAVAGSIGVWSAFFTSRMARNRANEYSGPVVVGSEMAARSGGDSVVSSDTEELG